MMPDTWVPTGTETRAFRVPVALIFWVTLPRSTRLVRHLISSLPRVARKMPPPTSTRAPAPSAIQVFRFMAMLSPKDPSDAP